MAQDLYSNLPPELFLQQKALNRQQEMAKMLLAQGAQQNAGPAGQMVSGRYVPNSFFQNLQGPVNQLLGVYMAEKGDKRALDLAEQLRKGKEQETQAIMEQLKPRDVQTQMAGPYTGNVPMPVATQTLPPDLQAATNLALQSRFGAGKELLPTLINRALPEPVKPTTDIQNYEFARSQGYKGSLNDFKNQISPIEKERLALDREKFEFDKSQKGAGKDLTESQGKASAFQSQMVSASNAVNTLEGQGFDPTLFKSQTAVKLAGGAANPLIPVAAQQYKQAQDQWSEAYLRFKTGAAATEPEVVRNNRTFFPVFGDKPEQIAQKAAAREQAERDIGIAAGRGANLGAQAIGQQPKQPTAGKNVPAPAGVDPKVWNAMTPQEKALFK
jgi:hypothetical protein